MRLARAVALGVFVALLVCAGAAQAASKFPKFSAPVVDAANVIPDSVEQTVDAELTDYQQRSGNQIAVAVVKTTGDQSIEDFSIDLARAWGVGTKGKDNGVLLLIAFDDHKLRIEVGRGLEGTLTDLQSGRIIREQITPRLRAGDPGGAVEAGTSAIRYALGDTQASAPVSVAAPDNGAGSGGSGFPWGALVFVLFIVGSTVGGLGRRRTRLGWAAPLLYGRALGGLGGGFGGGGGGGFGGGGGGGFGGGGASGGW